MMQMKTDTVLLLQNSFIYKVVLKVKHLLYIKCEEDAESQSSQVVVGISFCIPASEVHPALVVPV